MSSQLNDIVLDLKDVFSLEYCYIYVAGASGSVMIKSLACDNSSERFRVQILSRDTLCT